MDDQQPTVGPVIYTPAQVAELFQCSVGTVLRAIRAGRLPAFYISPQRPRIPGAALERFINEQGLDWVNAHKEPGAA